MIPKSYREIKTVHAGPKPKLYFQSLLYTVTLMRIIQDSSMLKKKERKRKKDHRQMIDQMAKKQLLNYLAQLVRTLW